jgi:formamidopyrimidine-DNA glycosylase
MPELPDITIYIEALQPRVLGQRLVGIRIHSPFVLRTYEPPLKAVDGLVVRDLRRIGKRVAIGFEQQFWLVIHLMIAGRLHWKHRQAKPSSKYNLAAFDFPTGILLLSEGGTKRRASIHLVRGEQSLRQQDPGGLELLSATVSKFRKTLCQENHTVKRALTDPHLFSGLGNAYSDEILHRARLSPFALTQKLGEEEVSRLFAAVQAVLREWIDRLRVETGDKFPENVTAFRPEMAVHGRYGLPCPVCSVPIQRIRYSHNETNYCPRCQMEGRILADRSLSRLLKDDWPKNLDELDSI